MLAGVFDPSVETLGYFQMSLRDKAWPMNGYEESNDRP